MKTDPICGMKVDEATACSVERDSQTFYFCSEHCRGKFLSQVAPAEPPGDCCGAAKPKPAGLTNDCGGTQDEHSDHSHHRLEHGAEKHSCCGGKAGTTHGHQHHDDSPHHHNHAAVTPATAAKYFCPMCPGVESDKPGDCPKCGMALERNLAWKPTAKTLFTCPMHPEIEQDHPGDCPKCGMALEPKSIVAESDAEEGNAELRNMMRRFWIGVASSLPVFIVAMAHIVPTWSHAAWLNGEVSRWGQFILSTPVVLWAGWPFFVRGARSLLNRSLNMFTLIALGVGAAYAFSAVAMFFPEAFPPASGHSGKPAIYFEAAAVITVLVLLGQVLEHHNTYCGSADTIMPQFVFAVEFGYSISAGWG